MANPNDKVSFPHDSIEALAMLYIQNQDISGLSPEDLFRKYKDAYEKIKECANADNDWDVQI